MRPNSPEIIQELKSDFREGESVVCLGSNAETCRSPAFCLLPTPLVQRGLWVDLGVTESRHLPSRIRDGLVLPPILLKPAN